LFLMSILWFSQSGDAPQEDLAIFWLLAKFESRFFLKKHSSIFLAGYHTWKYE
jgi:hypothetical protein